MRLFTSRRCSNPRSLSPRATFGKKKKIETARDKYRKKRGSELPIACVPWGVSLRVSPAPGCAVQVHRALMRFECGFFGLSESFASLLFSFDRLVSSPPPIASGAPWPRCLRLLPPRRRPRRRFRAGKARARSRGTRTTWARSARRRRRWWRRCSRSRASPRRTRCTTSGATTGGCASPPRRRAGRGAWGSRSTRTPSRRPGRRCASAGTERDARARTKDAARGSRDAIAIAIATPGPPD